jgi:hypothetical protein
VVLLRWGFGRLRPVLTVDRAPDGSVSCWEQWPARTAVTWRVPLGDLEEPLVIYSVPGLRLLNPGVPAYDSSVDLGATVQLDGEEVFATPQLVTLQIVGVPHAQKPRCRETVGDRCFDQGRPDLWVILSRTGNQPPAGVAVRLPPRPSPPPLALHVHRPIEPEPS